MTSQIVYEGELHTESTHLQSGTKIFTDAPVDNQGKGESFSPTDLVANALGCCMLTIMGIKSRDMGIELKGTKVDITKIMSTTPRKISEIQVTFNFPRLNLAEKERTILERAAKTCPVALTLSPEVRQIITFNW